MKPFLASVLLGLALTNVASPARAQNAQTAQSAPIQSGDAIPIVFGDFLQLNFDPARSSVQLRPGDPMRAMRAVEIDLSEGEYVETLYRGNQKFFAQAWLQDSSVTNGPTPGWKKVFFDMIPAAKPNKIKSVGIGSPSGVPGHYRIEFIVTDPGQSAWLNIWFFRPEEVFPPHQHNAFKLVKLAYAAYDDASKHPLDPALASPDRLRTVAVPAVEPLPSNPEADTYAARAPQNLQPYFLALYAGGEHDAVLNFNKLGLAAMEAGDFKTAEWAFDQSLKRIEMIYARSEAAKAARSKWAGEAIKDFKGEPYERAMAYYYRGLLYLRVGDYENARASFESAEFQDTLSESEEFQSDFALMDYLSGWSSHCAGDEGAAHDAFALAAKIRPDLAAPKKGDRTLALAELGRGPVKVTRGSQSQLLSFAWSADRDKAATAQMMLKARPSVTMVPAADITYQATTRGGRPIDAIMNGKAHFKERTKSAAVLLTYASGLAPVAMIPLGVISAIASGETVPRADTRMWDSLPDHIDLATISAPTSANVSFRFADDTNATSGKPWMTGGDAHCSIVWTRDRSAIAEGAGIPGDDPKVSLEAAGKDDQAAKDKAFRSELEARPSDADQIGGAHSR